MIGEFGRVFIILGVLLILMGLFFTPSKGEAPRLPGDIYIKKDNLTVYIPIVSTLIISIILTVIINIFFRK